MRPMPYLTVGALREKIIQDGFPSFSRPPFYRMEKDGVFKNINYHRTSGNHRSFSKQATIDVLVTIWSDFYGKDGGEQYRQRLEKELAEGKFFPHVKEY